MTNALCDSKRIATPGAVTEHFRDPARLVVSAPERPETSKELRCSFTDDGGDALLEFDRIEGKFKIELNGEVIAESDRTGYPQTFFVKLKNGINDANIKKAPSAINNCRGSFFCFNKTERFPAFRIPSPSFRSSF